MKSQLLQDISESADAQSKPKMAAAGTEASPFASERVDWVSGQAEDEPQWFDRWGRRAATWGIGLVLLAAAAGGGLWLYRERSIDNTLVMVAKNSPPAPQTSPAAALPTPAPAKAAVAGSAVLPARAAAAAPGPPLLAATPEQPGAERAAPQATPEPRAVAEVETTAAQPAHAHAKRMSSKLRAQTPAPLLEPETAPAGQLAETLRQCRAMGYHAAQCLKRGCSATRFGLVCKG